MEIAAKNTYVKFLKKSSWAQANRINDYFKQWTEAASAKGPFNTCAEKEAAIKTLEKTKNFHVSYRLEYF